MRADWGKEITRKKTKKERKGKKKKSANFIREDMEIRVEMHITRAVESRSGGSGRSQARDLRFKLRFHLRGLVVLWCNTSSAYYKLCSVLYE